MSDEFSSTRTLEDKLGLIVRSDNQFKLMQAELDQMQGAVKAMSDGDGDVEFFRQRVGQCQELFAEVCGLFVALKEESKFQTAPKEEQARDIWRKWLEPRNDLERAIWDVRIAVEDFESRVQCLRKTEDKFSTVPTLDNKLEAIEASNFDFPPMQDALGVMGEAVKLMPPQYGTPFRQRIANCEEQFARLWDSFAPLKEEISDWRARLQEQDETRDRLRYEYHTFLGAFRRRLSYVKRLADDFSSMETMATLDQKRELIGGFKAMQEELGGVQRTVERMRDRDCQCCGLVLAGCQEEFDQLCRLFAPLKQQITSPLADPNPLRDEFDTALGGFELRAAYLRERAKNFSRMRPEQKLQVIERSDGQFKMMRYQLGDVRRAVDKMPPPDHESHQPTLVRCREKLAELRRLFAPLKQGISDQEPREQEEEEQPRENWRGPE